MDNQISALLGTSTRQAETVKASAKVQKDRTGRWRLQLRTQQGTASGQRQMDAASCESLAKASALILAMMIDPDAATRAQPDESATAAASASAAPSSAPPARSTNAPAATTIPTAVSSAPQASLHNRVPLGLGPGIGVEAGPLPAPSVIAGLTLVLLTGALRWEASGFWRPTQDAYSADKPHAGGRFSYSSVALSSCWRAYPGNLEFGPCVGFETGPLKGTGRGVNSPSETTAWLAEATAGAYVAWKLAEGLALRAQATGLVALLRPSYVLPPLGEIHQPSTVGGRLYVGVEIRAF